MPYPKRRSVVCQVVRDGEGDGKAALRSTIVSLWRARRGLSAYSE